ncbi:MAG: GNAT family N-acetyltransferase [Verrucomicrobiae bacterium]|nr:GNAT family N-acetyltransferase [Verrucomicrobiae bacterium]
MAHANGRGFNTAAGLPAAIKALRAKGYEFVTVSELLAAGKPVIVSSCYNSKAGDTDRYDRLGGASTLSAVPRPPRDPPQKVPEQAAVAMSKTEQPFLAPCYTLGEVELALVTSSEAVALGPLVASMEPWRDYPGISAATLTAFLADVEPGAPRFAIRHNGGLAGTVTIRTNWFRGPYIHLLALMPAWQGLGIGADLMAFIDEEARRSDQRNLWVAATETNTGAIRFYERHGFVRTATIDGLVADGKTEVLLRKRLA